MKKKSSTIKNTNYNKRAMAIEKYNKKNKRKKQQTLHVTVINFYVSNWKFNPILLIFYLYECMIP